MHGGGPQEPNPDAVGEIRAELKTMHGELSSLRLDFNEFRGEMRGRITNIPTTFQIAFMLATFTVATFVGATGVSPATTKFAGAH